ncbi:hydroxyacid dehydrogenase [Dysosmobacter sp.]|uniref:hydroxyacid dehydrogenase n=1 Tax=Dysosmobacter sp. TaxID=2591382 RepID=UPI002A8A51BF|nr:hydroxyacid dehydrogenase [Dysosmobacter sp.]MDY3282465.1 hydroxyacid dehydrogenase [Dysosmobacter sp.]
MNKPLIYIPRQIAKEGRDYLTEHGFEYRVGTALDEDTMVQEIRGCDGMLLRTAHATRRVLEAEPKLQIVARHGVGLDIIDVAAATELGIQVVNTPTSNGLSVAEIAICGMSAVARKILPLNAAAKRGDFFYKNHCQGTELSGKTLGLIGFGHIGSHVARMAHMGFNMNIIVYKGHMEGKPIPEYVRLAEWDEVFQTADFVSVHIPLRPENVGIIGAREFGMMKPTAYFINTARGKLTDEAALAEALRSHAIAGAYLDVLASEPLSPEDPLLHLDNAVVTPHCGGSTDEALIRSAVYAAEELDRFFHGQGVRWPVNTPKK